MKIAAVIPVRNRPDLLRQAIRSVQTQTLPVDEIIVVDDASVDETVTVALSMARTDSRIRIIALPERRMVGAARNIAWRSTDADWIAFLDSDDEWLPEKTARQISLLSGSNVVACFTGLKNKDDDSKYLPPENVSLFELRRGNVLHTPSTCIVKRAALAAVGGFDEDLPSCSDWDLWLKLRRLGEIRVLREPLAYYDRSGQGRVSDDFDKVLKGHAILFERALSDVRGVIRRSRIRAYHHARIAQISQNFGEPLDAVIYSIRSGLNWPNGHAFYIARHNLRTLSARTFGFLLSRNA